MTEALYWLLVNATDTAGRDAALLLAVDDAHWLDEESLTWLEFLSERLAGLTRRAKVRRVGYVSDEIWGYEPVRA